MLCRPLIAAILALIAVQPASAQPVPVPVPVLFDTDIGTDIDDAYALALILRSPELELLGVTTVSGDAVARARLAAKLLALEGGPAARVPVYAGTSTATQYMKQADWAAGFTSPALHTDGGVAFMHQQIEARPGRFRCAFGVGHRFVEHGWNVLTKDHVDGSTARFQAGLKMRRR